MDNSIQFICLFLSVVSVCASMEAPSGGSGGKTGEDIRECKRVCRVFEGRTCLRSSLRNGAMCGRCLEDMEEKNGKCVASGGERARTFYFPDEEIEKASKNKMDNVAASSQAHDSHRGASSTGDSGADTGFQVEEDEEGDEGEEGEEGEGTPPVSTALPLGHNKQHGSWIQRKLPAVTQLMFISVIAGFSVAGFIGLAVAAVCYFRLQKNVKAVAEADYPAYGVTGPIKERLSPSGDRKLAQSAQMYHYQHQKQQMIAMEKNQADVNKDGSDVESDEENPEGDYTVYECPGLAPTGEMEVKNPLFTDDVHPGGDTKTGGASDHEAGGK